MQTPRGFGSEPKNGQQVHAERGTSVGHKTFPAHDYGGIQTRIPSCQARRYSLYYIAIVMLRSCSAFLSKHCEILFTRAKGRRLSGSGGA